MKPKPSTNDAEEPTESGRISGSQTLQRGLDVLEAVASGAVELPELAARLGLTRSTTYRLAATLVERRYLDFVQRGGYRLGPQLLLLGSAAQAQLNIVQVAKPVLEALATSTLDTVHLGILEEDRALYLDKVPGRRRVEIGSRVGERHPLTSTGLGKALLLDAPMKRWKELHAIESLAGRGPRGFSIWLRRMKEYVLAGHTFDLEENEDRIRCVAAPIRDASGLIVAAISVASATQYMDDVRMIALSTQVRSAAAHISAALGWAAGRESS